MCAGKRKYKIIVGEYRISQARLQEWIFKIPFRVSFKRKSMFKRTGGDNEGKNILWLECSCILGQRTLLVKLAQ